MFVSTTQIFKDELSPLVGEIEVYLAAIIRIPAEN